MFSWTDLTGSEYNIEKLGNGSCNNQLQEWQQDSQLITEKSKLPIMKINYGPMKYESQKVRITIGPLICYSNDSLLPISTCDMNDELKRICKSKRNHFWMSDKCIFLETTNLKVENAEANCKQLSIGCKIGKLYEPLSKKENDKVLQKVMEMADYKGFYAWIGLEMVNENVVYKSNKQKVPFQHWDTGHPTKSTDVVTFQFTTKWKVAKRKELKRQSVCEFM